MTAGGTAALSPPVRLSPQEPQAGLNTSAAPFMQ